MLSPHSSQPPEKSPADDSIVPLSSGALSSRISTKKCWMLQLDQMHLLRVIEVSRVEDAVEAAERRDAKLGMGSAAGKPCRLWRRVCPLIAELYLTA